MSKDLVVFERKKMLFRFVLFGIQRNLLFQCLSNGSSILLLDTEVGLCCE